MAIQPPPPQRPIYKVRCRVQVETIDRRWDYKVFYVSHPDPISIQRYINLYYDDYGIVIDYHIYDVTPVNNEP